MKNIILSLLVMAVLPAYLYAVEVTGDLVKDLGLKQATVEGATIFYDPRFEKQLPVFEKIYLDYRAKMKAGTGSGGAFFETFIANKDAILKDIAGIVGGDPNDGLVTASGMEQINKLGYDLAMPLTGTGNKIYLVMQTSTKEYLRSGGKIPNMQYDKSSDTASYQFFFELGKDNSSNQELLFPIASPGRIKEVAGSILFTLHDKFGSGGTEMDYVMIHEIAEMTILRRLKCNDPYIRWFSDGFANAITREMLRKYFTQKDVDSFLDTNSAAKYDRLRKEANLQYWMSLNYVSTNDWPVPAESELSLARYCFATELALQIVDEFGIDCVSKIIDRHIAERNAKNTGTMPAIIEKVTGFKVSEKMQLYQNFKNWQDGIAYYDQKLAGIDPEKEPDDRIFYLMRKLELKGQPFMPDALYIRMEIANLLYDSDRKEFAKRFVTDFADHLCRFWDDNIKTGGREFAIFFALGVDEPALAVRYADDMLKANPDHTNAMTVIMKTTEDKDQASKLAQKIISLEKDKESFCYKQAQKILEEK